MSEPPSEREKWEFECSLKTRELQVREAEIALRRSEHASSSWRSPVVVALLAAAVAAMGNAVVSFINGTYQRKLEDRKAEQTRILEMIKTGDADTAAANLNFLARSGLIADLDLTRKLTEFLETREPGAGPALPPAGSSDMPRGIRGTDDAAPVDTLESGDLKRAAQAIGRLSQGRATLCTAFLVGPATAITATFCVSEGKDLTVAFRSGSGEKTYKARDSPRGFPIQGAFGGFSVLELEGSPGAEHGVLTLSSEPVTAGSALSFVFFRGSGPQLAVTDVSKCSVVSVTASELRHSCDSGAGSAGAPLLAGRDLRVAGIHVGADASEGMALRADVVLRAMAGGK